MATPGGLPALGANVGATRANDLPRQTNEYGKESGDDARSRTIRTTLNA
jgi:hypothetical protein